MFLRYELCTFGAENFTLLRQLSHGNTNIPCEVHICQKFLIAGAVYCLDETFKTVCNCMKLHSTLWNSIEIRTEEYVRYVYVILLILYSCIRYMYKSWTNYIELHRTVWNSIEICGIVWTILTILR